MKVIKILCILQGIALLFLVVPYTLEEPNYGNWFPLLNENDAIMALRTYYWFFFNNVSWVVVFFVIYELVQKKYKPYVLLFALMELLILGEYILRYNFPWIRIPFTQTYLALSHLFIILKIYILGRLIWEERA